MKTTKTLEQELEELDLKKANDAEALRAKHAVLSAFGDTIAGYHPPFVHYGKLYGTVGSVSFKGTDYDTLREGKQPDGALLRVLLDKYPPVGKVEVKDGCTSFRLASGDWKGDLLDVCPVTIDIETYQSQRAAFHWFAEINGALWRMELSVPLHSTTLGVLTLKWEYDRYHNPIRVELCTFRPNHGANCIRFASGGQQYPNNFTLWWDVDSGKALDFPSFIKGAK